MTVADLHTLAGVYALSALDDVERDAFEHHLTQCETCATEVREFLATTSRLALAAGLTPPAAMKQQVLQQISGTRQEPPTVDPPAPHRRTMKPTGRALRFTLAASIAAALALGGVAVWQYQSAQDARQQVQQAQADTQQIAAVLSAPDANTVTGALGTSATATVVESPSVNRAVFLTSGLPTLPNGKVYQLWFDDAGAMRPAGLVVPAAKDQTVLMNGRVDAAKGMGITVEPAGGSAHPTTTPLALMRFPSA